MTPSVPSPIHDVIQSTAARPGIVNSGRMIFVSIAPINSSSPKSSNSGSNSPARKNITTRTLSRSLSTKPPLSPEVIKPIVLSGLSASTPKNVSQMKIAPRIRIATQIAVVENVFATIGYVAIKFGLPRKTIPRIADNVTMPTQSPGNISPIESLIMSAMILTTIVQLPSYCTGIMNKIIPTIDGTKNPANEPCGLCSISILLRVVNFREQRLLAQFAALAGTFGGSVRYRVKQNVAD